MRGKKAKFLRNIAKLNPALPELVYEEYRPVKYTKIQEGWFKIVGGVPRKMGLCIRSIYKQLKKDSK